MKCVIRIQLVYPLLTFNDKFTQVANKFFSIIDFVWYQSSTLFKNHAMFSYLIFCSEQKEKEKLFRL